MKPGDSFICLSIDRMFRSVHDFSGMCKSFQSAKINPIFVRDQFDMRTPTGKLMANMCASFAQFKSDVISARVREGKAVAAAKSAGFLTQPKTKILQANNPKLAALVRDANITFDYGLPKKCGRAWGYTRVSTGGQSVASQIPTVQATIDRMVAIGYQRIPDLFSDHGVSAFSVDWKDRPLGKQMYDQLQPYDCVCVSRLDRIFRSVHDMANTIKSLLERDIHIVTGCGLDTRTPMGRQSIEILSMMAAWESRDISWRTKMAMSHLRSLRGKWFTDKFVPKWMDVVYNENGWTCHPNLIKVEQFREVRELLDVKGMKITEVADFMEERIAARLGRPVVPATRFNSCAWIKNNKARHTAIERKALKKWFKTRPKDKDGYIDREWSYIAVKNARRDMEFLEDVMSS